MTKPTITKFSEIAPLIIQGYQSHIPTAFDDSLSLLEKMNNIIKYLNDVGKVSNDVVVQWNTIMEWVMNDGLNESVIEKLDSFVDDGTFSAIINNELFSNLNLKLEGKADKSFVTSLGSASPKGVYPSLSALQTAFPNGTNAIYIVGTSWYYWSGTAWTVGGTYQSSVLGEQEVKSSQILKQTIQPLDLSIQNSLNLFDKTQALLNSIVGNDGVVVTLSGWYLTAPIPVNVGEDYAITNSVSSQGAFYDSNMNWISKVNQSVALPLGGFKITVPPGVAFMRLNLQGKDTYMVVKGNKYPDSYYAFGEKYTVPWLRTEIETLPSKIVTMDNIDTTETVNLFNRNDITVNKYLDNTGALLDTTIISVTGFFKVNGGGTYTYGKGYSTNGGMYDKNKNWIGAIPHPVSTQQTPYTFTLPKNCAYLRMNVVKGDEGTMMLVSGTSYPSEYSGYGITIPWLKVTQSQQLSKWSGKKLGFLGDSITEKNFRTTKNYHEYISEKIGSTNYNYGVSGTGWRTPNSSGTGRPFHERVATLDSTLDLVFVFGGTNDWGQTGLPLVLGNYGDTTTSTFYGTVDTVIKQLVAKYPTKIVAVATPLQRSDGFVANGSGYTLEDVANAILKVCNKYGVPCLDLYHGNNLNVWDSVGNTTNFTPSGANIPQGFENADGLHPNDNGHKIIADKILSFINRL